ncbi:hypothetical protein LB467_05130 [Salegentibacter sp. JZCK2]|uniref:hypothetical protein n=1 Tax=Salegentibacter tibetensis TaxID=2873600 RepID=UPI001CCF98C2|nr:hypothetical protein [Salegentibacter tibetensis]MBZ9729060.1 hypothetical protein [Salegentibacter tibetensis]
MKNVLILVCMAAFLSSCSVEDQPVNESELNELDLLIERDGCSIYSFEFDEVGQLEVRSFYDYLSIKFSSKQNYSLKKLNLHFAERLEDFPLNKIGLIPGRMEHKYNYDDNTYETEITFPLDEVPDSFLMAAYAVMESPTDKFKGWAGDIAGEEGDWSYAEYEVKEFSFYAGTDQMREISISDAEALPSWDAVRKVYAGMLDAGVDRNNGTYEPSIWDIINDFNDPGRESKLGDYTTIYTLGTGECSDSVELTLRVIPD